MSQELAQDEHEADAEDYELTQTRTREVGEESVVFAMGDDSDEEDDNDGSHGKHEHGVSDGGSKGHHPKGEYKDDDEDDDERGVGDLDAGVINTRQTGGSTAEEEMSKGAVKGKDD